LAGSKSEQAGAGATLSAAGTSASTSAASASGPAAFVLVHHTATGKKPAFAPTRLLNPVVYLGRTPQNDIVLPSENVSRRHAKLIVTDMGITVHDLDSHNGVFLNGKKVRSTALSVGDLLYVGDVCVELKPSEDSGGFSRSSSSRVTKHEEITGEEEPGARNLATLLRASEVVAVADDETWATSAMDLCRELTEATVGVLIWKTIDGMLETPVVLQPESGSLAEIPVLWPVVRKALEGGASQFSGDLKQTPITDDEAVAKSDVGAVLAAPILVEGQAEGVIYLARPSPSPVFTERELETVSAICQLFAIRKRPTEAVAVESVEPHGDALALQAKVEAAEARLGEALADARTLTERVHGLEAEALKLRQQIEIEKQSAIDAKREAERGRMEASKLEHGLHKTDEDAKKLKDVLTRVEEERTKLKAELAEQARSGQAREEEIKRLTAELARVVEESKVARAGLERSLAESGAAEESRSAALEALRAALRVAIPTTVAEHIEANAESGSLVTDAVVRPVAALFVTLQGLDAWAMAADPAALKKRLDVFCNSVALRVRANGGRVEQVLGHNHLVLFPADAGSVRAAVRCGVEIGALVPPGDGVGVVCALHVAPSTAGFFGEADAATRVEAGEAVLVSRGIATTLAHEPAFYVTEAVQKLVANDPMFSLAILGTAALVGAPRVLLFRVFAGDGAPGAS
jgi:class 3 adenylate cyclase/predicted  nucleic acid-binding Zn-ribbon protein